MTIPHNTGLYVPAGRGIMYIGEWTGTTPPTYPTAFGAGTLEDFIDIGNAPSFEIEPVTEKRPHYSSREGVNLKDLNPVTVLDYNLTFTLDEVAASNLNMFLLGTLDAATRTIAGMQGADKEYAVIFVSNNPIGPNAISFFRRVTINPNGPMQLIGNEYLTMTYMGEGLADVSNYPNSPYFDYKIVTTTTTSTTTTSTTA